MHPEVSRAMLAVLRIDEPQVDGIPGDSETDQI